MATMAASTLLRPPHLMTLADLSVPNIHSLVSHASYLKRAYQPLTLPTQTNGPSPQKKLWCPKPLKHKTIALLFSKRSTRTRISAETATDLLGGRALFLGKEDIQLGVNESVRDSARVISGMAQGIFARVGDHSEIEELAKYSEVPVINALSSLWHPTQILADLLTLREIPSLTLQGEGKILRPLTVAYVGDSANVLHDMLVTYPRLGHELRVASPEKYRAPPEVWDRVVELGCDKGIFWTADPKEAVHGADVVITDTWISMGQEAEKEQRLKDFQGYQVTEELCREGGAKDDWKFLHCLPRKEHEVDDDVFYGKRSHVFPESDNRKWTIMALFNGYFGHWQSHPKAWGRQWVSKSQGLPGSARWSQGPDLSVLAKILDNDRTPGAYEKVE